MSSEASVVVIALLFFIALGVSYCVSRLGDIRQAVDDIQDRLKHLHPLTGAERQELADEDDEPT